MGYGRLTEKVASFKEGVELIRTERYGDLWMIRVRIERTDYRVRSLETTSLPEAQGKAFTAWQSINLQVESQEHTKVTTIRLFHFFLEYQNRQVELGKLSDQTAQTKKSSINSSILPYIVYKNLKVPRRINSNRDFRDFPDWRLAQGINPSTVNNEIIIIKEAFRWFRREEYIDYDPPYIESCPINQRKRDESNPPIKVDDFLKIKQWLDDYCNEDIKASFESNHANKLQKRTSSREMYIRKLFRSYVHICTSAALRPHEWRALDWSMIKVGHENEIEIPPWTKTGRRLVIFYSDKFEELRKIQQSLPNVEWTKATPVGLDPNTGKTLGHKTYTDRWKIMMKALDLNYNEYCMRSAGICRRLENGTPIFTVARWAGNSVRVIEQNYTASIMRSQRMRKQVLLDEEKKWEAAGILGGDLSQYKFVDLD